MGVQGWKGTNCASGAANVAVGTTCEITAASGYTCTNPGKCGYDGSFASKGECKKADVCFTLEVERVVIRRGRKNRKETINFVVKGQPGDSFRAQGFSSTGCDESGWCGSDCIRKGWGKGLHEIINQRNEVVAYGSCSDETNTVRRTSQSTCTGPLTPASPVP